LSGGAYLELAVSLDIARRPASHLPAVEHAPFRSAGHRHPRGSTFRGVEQSLRPRSDALPRHVARQRVEPREPREPRDEL